MPLPYKESSLAFIVVITALCSRHIRRKSLWTLNRLLVHIPEWKLKELQLLRDWHSLAQPTTETLPCVFRTDPVNRTRSEAWHPDGARNLLIWISDPDTEMKATGKSRSGIRYPLSTPAFISLMRDSLRVLDFSVLWLYLITRFFAFDVHQPRLFSWDLNLLFH